MDVSRETGAKSRYRRQRVKHPCSKCGGERDTTGRYCRLCRSAYMRAWRANRKTFHEQVTPVILALLEAPTLTVCSISPERLAEMREELQREHPHSGTRRRDP